MEEELLPPPPKKVVSQNGESDLLPPPPKKKLNEPTSGSVEVSKTVSTPQSVPSSVSGTKGKFIIEPTEANIQELAEKRISDLQGKSSMNDARKYAIDEINKVNSRVTGNITLGDESRQMGIAKGDVFGEIKVNAENAQKALEGINQSRYVRTKKLQEQTVAKQDQVFLEGKKIENLSNQIDFATKLPQYKELTAIDEQLKAMGEPKTKEQIGAYNALIAKRDALLDTDVSQTDEYNATVTIPTFDMPSDDMSEEVNRQNQIKDIVNKGKKSFEAKAAYEGKVKLRDVLGVADMKSKELSSSIAKYKENAAQIDLNIKEMYNLNKDKLEKVGFTKGFFDGINQTTMFNTLADFYLLGDDDQLGKSLENLYMEQATMPTETTVGGDIGTMIGGQVKPMAVAFGTSVVSANPAVGVGTGALYYGRMGIGSGLLDVYTTARSQGRTQAEALALAKKQAVAGGVGGVVEGLAGLLTAGGKPVAGIVSNGFKQAVKTGLKEVQIDAVTAGLVTAGQNANIQRLGLDRKLHEGVIENMAGEAFFSVGAKVAITGGQKVRGYGTIVNTMAKGSFRDIQAIVDDAVKQGIANEANASQFIQDVQKSAKAQEKLKGVELNEDVEDDVISLQTKIDELEAQKKNASPATIGELDRQINELSAKLKVEAGFPLTPDERKELNLLQTARDSNKEYDKEKLAELEQRQKNNQDGKTKIVTDQPIRVKYKDGRTGLVFVNAEGDVEFVPDGNSAGLVIDKQAGASFRSLANLGFEQVVGETVAEPNSQLLSGDIAVGTNVLYKGGKYQIASSKNAPDGVKLDADGKVRVVYLKGEDGKVIAVGADSADGKRIIDDANRVIGKGEATPTETAPVVEAKKKTDETVEVELEPAVTEDVGNSGVFSLGENKIFFHASSQKRNGRLKSSNAPQFGTGVYFSTNKDLVQNEFGENITEAELTINKPVYTNTKEWNEIEREAIKLADEEYGKKKGLKLGEDETYFRYDPDNISEIAEIPSYHISDAAKKLGYDAIIDKNSSQYENEIIVLDESKILYPENKQQVEAVQTPTETVTEAEVVTPIAPDGGEVAVETAPEFIESTEKVIQEAPKVEQVAEKVQKFKDVLDQRTDKKTDKALKAFGEQEAKAKELIDNYDTNLKKLEEKGVEVKGTKAEILADMLDGKYDEALKSDTSIPSSKTETKTEVPKGKTTETPKTKLQTAKEKLAEAKRKRDELAKKKSNLGAFKDSFGEAEEQAKADRELFDAYVDFAKEYISEVGGTIQDWAKEINEEVDENLKRAWDLANSKGGVKKTVLTTRVYEGDTREEVRKEIEKFGLNRDRIPHAEAEANAKKLIEQVGLDMAYQATINGDIVGGSAAEVYAAKIRDLNEQINSAKTTEEIEILSKDLAAVYSRFSNVATEAGQFGSQLGYIYDRDSDLGYNYEKKIKEYKDANNGEIPAEIAAKFKELDDQIKELSKQIKEAENKAQKASEQQAVDEIKASIKRNPTANKKAKAKRLMSEGLDDIAQALGDVVQSFAH